MARHWVRCEWNIIELTSCLGGLGLESERDAIGEPLMLYLHIRCFNRKMFACELMILAGSFSCTGIPILDRRPVALIQFRIDWGRQGRERPSIQTESIFFGCPSTANVLQAQNSDTSRS